MSVYSGFATRSQQQLYDNLIGNVMAALSLRIIKFYKREAVDERKFKNVLEHQCRYLRKMEKRKFMQPKYAEVLEDLIRQTDVPEEAYTETKTLQNTPSGMNRTLTMITSQLKNIRDLGDKEYLTEANSLEKISEKVFRRKKKRTHSKKGRQGSLQYQLQDLQEVKREKMPQLNNFRLREEDQCVKSRTEWMRDTRAHIFNNAPNPSPSQKVIINDESLKRIMQGTKFRTKMFQK